MQLIRLVYIFGSLLLQGQLSYNKHSVSLIPSIQTLEAPIRHFTGVLWRLNCQYLCQSRELLINVTMTVMVTSQMLLHHWLCV